MIIAIIVYNGKNWSNIDCTSPDATWYFSSIPISEVSSIEKHLTGIKVI